jgi:hypothetical protein
LSISKQAGISLVVIPYWWRNSEESLKARIGELRPDIFKYQKINETAPRQPSKTEEEYIPSKSQAYDENTTDPTGFLVSEKYNGVRAFWDGHDLRLARNAKKIITPTDLSNSMPPHYVEGELWWEVGL